MIPELAASTINSSPPAATATPDRHLQAAFQRQLEQAREERQPDSAAKPEAPAGESGAAGNTQASDADRQAERLRNQNASQRKARPATPAAPEKPAAGQPATAAATPAPDKAGPADSSKTAAADAPADDAPATAAPGTAIPLVDQALASLLAASQSKAPVPADPAVAVPVAAGQATADASAASQPAHGARHTGGTGHELPTAAAGRASAGGPAGAASEAAIMAGPAAVTTDSAAGPSFESKMAQARQSLPAEMLRGMTSPAGSDLAALQARLDVAGAPPAAAPVTIATVEAPIGSQAFAPEFTEHISTMIDGGIERAEILVTPKDMGPVRIELTLSGDDARLVFTAAQPDTRQAIEQSSALLRSMLAERGLTLGSMDINQGNAGNPQSSRQPENTSRGNQSPSVATRMPLVGAGGSAGARRGLLDLFA